MRQIKSEQLELIDAVLAEVDVGGVTAGILEKDIHVTDVLHMLAGLSFPHLRFVFCGGTSLAKAHHVIERMSEDVDIKMVLAEGIKLSRNAIKTMLIDVKKQIIAKMEDLGFARDDSRFNSRNEHHYFSTAWHYQSAYPSDQSLRPHLILEFTERTPRFSTSLIQLPYLVDQFAQLEGATVPFEVISVEETFAEKILSFLRRHALHRSGNMQQAWDATLVRHIYDVYCIATLQPQVVENAKLHFKELVQLDVDEFSQHQEFVDSPKDRMLAALKMAETEAQTIQEYQTRLLPLIHGAIRPDFALAFGVFKVSSLALIHTL